MLYPPVQLCHVAGVQMLMISKNTYSAFKIYRVCYSYQNQFCIIWNITW